MRWRINAVLRRLRSMPRTLGGWRSVKRAQVAAWRGDWPAVVTAYTAALVRNGHMTSAWISLGYAQLEIGDPRAAAVSFGKAASLEPTNAEPFRALAYAAQSEHQAGRAASHFLSAYERSGLFTDLSAFAAALPIGEGRTALLDAARRTVPLLPLDSIQTVAATATLLLDISELLLWYRSFRLPSGVQRVQIGLIAALLSQPNASVNACCFERGEWKAIGTEELLALLTLSESGDRLDDPEWQRALLATWLSVSRGGAIAFAYGTVMVSLGSWVTDEFLEAIDAAKRDVGLKYVPLIYDLIPLFHPEWFPPGVAENFPRWLDRLARSADGYITISQSTKDDLCRITGESGRLDPASVTVMALDADCRSRFAVSAPTDTLERYGLPSRGYVLSVGTIEPRKNHVNALRAWQRLLSSRAAEIVPTLVFVGHSGWKNEKVHRLLGDDQLLRSKVRMLSGVSDGDLSAFYANALFILYPSLYEGWGLPVTEALCYGRAVAASDNSSLPEAGGPFADYFDATDVEQIVAVAGRLIDDHSYLAERERYIANAYVPRSWRDLAADLERAAILARTT